MKALLLSVAGLYAAAGFAADLRYVKVDRPTVTLTFPSDGPEGTAVVIDEASGQTLVEGRTVVYDDADAVRIEPSGDSPCPSFGVKFAVDPDDPRERRARLTVRAPTGGTDPACRADLIAGEYARAR